MVAADKFYAKKTGPVIYRPGGREMRFAVCRASLFREGYGEDTHDNDEIKAVTL